MGLNEITQKEYGNIEEKKENKVQASGNSNSKRLSSKEISKGKGNEAFSEMGRNLERDVSQYQKREEGS